MLRLLGHSLKAQLGTPGTARHSHAQPGTARRSQTQPGKDRHCQAQPDKPLHTQSQPSTASHSPAQPSTARRSQTKPGTVMQSHAQPGTARRSSSQPRVAIHSQAQPRATRHSQTKPGIARHRLAQPSAARRSQAQPRTARHSHASLPPVSSGVGISIVPDPRASFRPRHRKVHSSRPVRQIWKPYPPAPVVYIFGQPNTMKIYNARRFPDLAHRRFLELEYGGTGCVGGMGSVGLRMKGRRKLRV